MLSLAFSRIQSQSHTFSPNQLSPYSYYALLRTTLAFYDAIALARPSVGAAVSQIDMPVGVLHRGQSGKICQFILSFQEQRPLVMDIPPRPRKLIQFFVLASVRKRTVSFSIFWHIETRVSSNTPAARLPPRTRFGKRPVAFDIRSSKTRFLMLQVLIATISIPASAGIFIRVTSSHSLADLPITDDCPCD